MTFWDKVLAVLTSIATSPAFVVKHFWREVCINILGDPAIAPDEPTPSAADFEALKLIKGSNAANVIGGAVEKLLALEFDVSGKAFKPITDAVLDVHKKLLAPLADVKPGDEEATASNLLTQAIGAGVGAHFAAVAAETLYPTKNLGVPMLAAIMSEIAGFGEIMGGIIGPEMKALVELPHTYSTNARARSLLPSLGQVLQMFARRKIDEATADELLGFAGLSRDYVTAMKEFGYRPISPFILSAGFTNADIDQNQLRQAVENNGLTPSDTDLTIQVVNIRSLQSVRQEYVKAAVSAAEKGVISLDELDQVLDEAKYGQEAKLLTHKSVLLAQRESIAAATERDVISELEGGEIDAATASGQMSAAGIQDWRVQLTVSLGAAKAALKEALREQAEGRKLAKQTQLATNKALQAQFDDGVLDAPALTAGLTTALAAYITDLTGFGATPAEILMEEKLGTALIAAQVSQAEATRLGRPRLVYRKLLDPAAAQLLTARVEALKEAVIRTDLTPDDALTQLIDLGIDQAEALALSNRWRYQVGGKGAIAPR